jgi:hypothetical protein
MSAKKDFYLAVKQALEDNAPSVKTVRLFNNQFQKIEQEKPFPFPAVMVHFLELDYSTRGDSSQDGETIVRLHIGYDSIKDEDLEIFDLLDEIHGAIQGLTVGELFTPLDRVFEEQDIDHDVISVWSVDYSFKLRDTEANNTSNLVKTTLTGVDVNISPSKPWLRQN